MMVKFSYFSSNQSKKPKQDNVKELSNFGAYKFLYLPITQNILHNFVDIFLT